MISLFLEDVDAHTYAQVYDNFVLIAVKSWITVLID